MSQMWHISLNKMIALLVVLFFTTSLIGSKGYQYAASILLLLGFFTFPRNIKQHMQNTQSAVIKLFSLSILFYFGTFFFSLLIHNDKLRELDAVSRALLCIPLVYLLVKYQLKQSTVFLAIISGAIIAGMIAFIDAFILSKPAAFSDMMQIQGGGISMSLGVFSLCIGFYYLQQHKQKIAIISFLASILGISASILSTSRGAWLGLPIILPIIFYYYRHCISKRFYLITIISLLIAIISMSLMPQFKLVERLDSAKNEIQIYFEQGNGSTSVGARFDMWKGALFAIKEKPITGWGKDGANKKRQEQAQAGLISDYAGHFNQPHNQYLEATMVRGIIGLIGLLGIFIVPLIIFLKKTKNAIHTNDIKLIRLLGVIHILEVMSYCLPQGFLVHQSGTLFYFITLSILVSLLIIHFPSNADKLNNIQNQDILKMLTAQ
ncbi:O-antigen ligase family protein [Spirabiliibacterium falconis]|uniref:O-antigen ligase family protein n=1 Tax=Spirabiliibacterium falconis TaxID=572023 RepID=UPI001AAD6F4C|nr:O-antigen ligase family protein [Spirabiliibacterium falconis]MBE2893894.1 O-antigen ligase family protein [Spirabiliibacterium falconis]